MDSQILDALQDIKNELVELNQGMSMILENHMSYPTDGRMAEMYSLMDLMQKHLEMIEMKD